MTRARRPRGFDAHSGSPDEAVEDLDQPGTDAYDLVAGTIRMKHVGPVTEGCARGALERIDDEVVVCRSSDQGLHSTSIVRNWSLQRGDQLWDLECEIGLRGRDRDSSSNPDQDTIDRAAALCRSVRLDEK